MAHHDDVADPPAEAGGGASFLPLVERASTPTGSAIAGHRVSEPTIDLTFPLRDGHFYVGQGGSTSAVNYHVVNATQRYALDIQKLTRWGNRAVRFLPFPGYGVPVHAACAGRVQQVDASMRDNAVDAPRDPAARAAITFFSGAQAQMWTF
jgi:hypothetical protein